jgi:flagellar protein FliO/FliZ
VIDAAAVDGRRRLVLVRRDNVEHLLMIGGPTDIVVEPNIVRAMPGRDQMAQRSGVGAEPQPRIVPLPDAIGWSDGDGPRSEPRSDVFDHTEPQMPELPRPVRPTFADELRRPAPAPSERRERSEPLRSEPLRSEPLRSDPLTSGFAPEPIGSPLGGRPEPRPELRGEPMPSRVTSRNEPIMPRPQRPSEAPKVPPVRAPERTAAPPPPPPSPPPPQPTADQNLAEMAQRLEAALRRPAQADGARPAQGAPQPAPRAAPQQPAPEPIEDDEMDDAPPPAPPPRQPAPAESARPARGDVRPARADPRPAAPQKSLYDSLEQEMASLLGRPNTKP